MATGQQSVARSGRLPGVPVPQRRRATFLSRVSDADRGALVELGRRLPARAGATLVARGDPEPPVFLLVSGAVKAFRSATPDSAPTLIDIYGAGDVLGIESLAQGRPGQLTYVTARPGEYVVIAQSAFEAYLDRSPQVMNIVFTTLARRMADRDAALSYASNTVRERLVALLDRLRYTHGVSGRGETLIEVGITQAEIASVIGASEASVNREITKLRELGFLEVGYRAMRIKKNLHSYLKHGPID